MNLAAFMAKVQPAIEENLAEQLTTASQLPALAEAMNYSVMNGGKRLRPALSLAVLADLGLAWQNYLTEVSAVELVHTYSLIHDDLPAMDDDDLRRGQPTSHKVYGEALAILAGDALQPLAYQWLAQSELLSAGQKSELMLQLAQASGADGMVAGQVADMAATAAETITLEQAMAIHYRKTGALLGYAAVAGGIIGQTNEDALSLLWDFGMTYGLAFQIKDDLDDLAQDDTEDKQSYPYLLGVTGAQQALQQQVMLAQEQVDGLQTLTGHSMQQLNAFLAYFKDEME